MDSTRPHEKFSHLFFQFSKYVAHSPFSFQFFALKVTLVSCNFEMLLLHGKKISPEE